MSRFTPALAAIPLFALAACATHPPSGPSVMALPPQGKTMEVFQEDDLMCRGYADQRLNGIDPAKAGQQSALGSAAVGTALGAGTGMALGSLSGAMGAGAAVGGAAGLLMGSAIGSNNAHATTANLQQRYDIAYTQCMYSRGNAVQAAPVAQVQQYPYPPYGGASLMLGGGWGSPFRRYYW